MSSQDILYRRNIDQYPGWAGVCSDCDGTGQADGWPEGVNCGGCDGTGYDSLPADVVIVADVPPVDDADFVIALTPGVVETTPWQDREALAAAVAGAAGRGLVDSWWSFVDNPANMDANGDIWA